MIAAIALVFVTVGIWAVSPSLWAWAAEYRRAMELQRRAEREEARADMDEFLRMREQTQRAAAGQRRVRLCSEQPENEQP